MAPTHCLHDPVFADHFPYVEFPKSWPIYTPKVRSSSLPRLAFINPG